MTARIVITSTVHSVHGGKHHAESIIPGVPICGAPLRNWTRAVAVDDRGLCGSCWPAVSEDKSVNLSSAVSTGETPNAHTPLWTLAIQTGVRHGRIGATPADAPTSHRGLTTRTADAGDMAMSHRNAAHPREAT